MQPTYKTKGQLLDILLDRCGYGGIGAAAGNFVPYANDLLVEAQEQMFERLRNDLRKQDFFITLNSGQVRADIPTNCNVDEIECVEVLVDGYWIPVEYGIETWHDNIASVTSHPARYEINYNPDLLKSQFEFTPTPGKEYSIRVKSELTIGPFAADSDYCSIDYRLVLLYAIAYAKSHLGRADKQEAVDALNFRLRELRANQHGAKRYIRGRKNRPAQPKPVVV